MYDTSEEFSNPLEPWRDCNSDGTVSTTELVSTYSGKRYSLYEHTAQGRPEEDEFSTLPESKTCYFRMSYPNKYLYNAVHYVPSTVGVGIQYTYHTGRT